MSKIKFGKRGTIDLFARQSGGGITSVVVSSPQMTLANVKLKN